MIKKIIIYQHDAVGVIGRGKMNLHNLNSKHRLKTRKTLISSALISVLTLSSFGVIAEISNDKIEQMTITATRSAINAEDALASVIIITRSDIENAQAHSLTEVLSTAAGIDLSEQGGKGQQSSIFMRGANANHTLVLVDGVRISSATLGSTNINNISPETVERIEIIKGPRAALWGSDAIGGVIQIFTRKLEGGEYFIGATTGTDNFKQARLGFGVQHGDGQTTISFNHEKSDGFNVLETFEDDDDGYDQTTVSIKGQQQINKGLSLHWLASAVEGESEYDPKYGSGTNINEVKNHVWQVKANYQVSEKNHTSISIGQNRDSGKDFGGEVASSSYIEKGDANLIQTRRDQLSIVNNYQHSNELQLNLGVDFYNESISSDTSYAEDEREVLGAFVHGFYQLESFDFELALRHDDVEFIDEETTYNVGAGYNINSEHRFIVNIGTGFKAPTFNDLYWPSAGNPDLIAETSETIEAVYTGKVNSIEFGFTVYQSDIENLINWAPNDTGAWQPQNVDEVEISGAEFTAQYSQGDFSHQVNASYTDTENVATGKQLDRRARERFSYAVTTDIAGIALNAEYQFNGKRYDSSGFEKLGSYQLVNLRASYPINDKLAVQLKVENAFDKEYQTAKYYNTQDRAFYLGITYSQF